MNKTVLTVSLVVGGIIVVILFAKLLDDRKIQSELKNQLAQANYQIAVLQGQVKAQQQSNAHFYQYPRTSFDVLDYFDHMNYQLNQLMDDSFANVDAKLDLNDSATEYIFTIDLPGMQKDDIKIETQEGYVIVSGERNNSNVVNNQKNFYQERTFGAFKRVIPLPKDAKKDKINATYENGVLKISIEKDKHLKQENSNQVIKVN